MKNKKRPFPLPAKLIVLITIFGFTALASYSQLAVNLQLQPSGLIQKRQLWNMAVINASGEKISMLVELNVIDSRNGARVLSASSGVIQISSGAKQLSLNDMMPVQYQYMNPLYKLDASQDGLLPVGIFKFCYNFFKVSSKGTELILEECRESEVAPLSPPILNMPQDSAKLTTKYPQFTWIPPTPIQAFKGLNYELRIVEMQQGQNSAEALQKNLPFAEKGNLREPYLPYPASLPPFDTAAFYAWQVTAFDASGYSAKSEIWVFSMQKDNPNKLKVTNAFIWLKRGEDPSLFISNGRIKFTYENILTDTLASYQLIRVSANAEQVVRAGKMTVSSGQNFSELNFDGKRFWKENEVYRFELLNSKNEKWKLNVKFIDKEEE